MTRIQLYEFEPTRSLKCRWALLEAGLEYESIGNTFEIIGSDAIKAINPTGKVPAIVINDKPLFESSAIVAAIADLVPEKQLIASPGSWQRALHDQWTLFATTELEMWAWSAILNTRDLILADEQRLPVIVDQMKALFDRGAETLEKHLADKDYVMGDEFSVTDINVSYTLQLAALVDFMDGYPNLEAYLSRLTSREHCQLRMPTQA